MTNEEASEVLWFSTIHLGGFSDSLEAIKIARKALEKQIPYKDSRCIGKAKLRICKCGIAYSQKTIKYCNNCGQAIDWSEDD